MLMQSSKRWNMLSSAPERLLRDTPEHPLLVQVLYHRGLTSARAIAAFLAGEHAVRENPYRLRDMAVAVTRILHAIELGETICVYGDFDADGVTATALLVNALQIAGARVGSYIPDRVDEGYGLNIEAIERIADQAKLIITVDCGMRSVVEVQRARALGLDVIITDHHSLGSEMPPALALINPRRPDCPSKFERLAGVGVAYRLAQAVLRAAARQRGARLSTEQVAEVEGTLLDFVALGTVADMMPLMADNRSLVTRGLARINDSPRTGIAALMAQADVRPGTVDATAISFRLAPRINAAGRLAHARQAYKLLRTNDAVEAYTLAGELEALNQRRQNLTVAAQAEAEAQVAEQVAGAAPLLFIHSSSFLPGIVGLVAGRLTERFYRPAVVIERGEQESRGSARSIREFDINRALDEMSSLFVRHGGHNRAAGFTVRTDLLPVVADALQTIAARELAQHSDLRPTLDIDATVELDQLTWGLLEQFARLEPTGQDNPPPLLALRGVRLREAKTVADGKHLKLVVDSHAGSPVLDAIAFHQGERRSAMSNEMRLDLVFNLEANDWQGRRMLQLNVQDLRSTGSDR